MKFKINSNTFADKLNLVQGIAEKRATMPILSHLLLNVEKGKIKITSTDLETTMCLWCEASVEKESSLAIPSRKLFEIVKELQNVEMEFEEIGNNWLQIKTASASFKIAGLSPEDFPSIPEVSTANLFSINSAKLEDMISKTIFSVSPDELRRNLSGIFFEKTGDKGLRLIATDGHRLSYIDYESENDLGLAKNVLVPKKAVSELRKILRFSDEILIGAENNFFVSKVDDTVLYSRLIDADFPDYRQVTPDTTKNRFKVNTTHLLSALKRVSIFSSEKTRSVKVSLNKNELLLISVAPEVGEAKESILIEYSGEPMEIGFNSRYIMDVLEAIGETVVIFGISDELSPTVIRPESGDHYVNVVMPMRV
ncbi:MAG: DNA polymerase III subunit beta [Thermodesulfobacteriota bacterium]